jgi:hypothetical protein
MPRRSFLAVPAGLAGLPCLEAAEGEEIWIFDRLDRIGGHPVKVEGAPRVVDTPLGKAIEFDGVDDALYIDVHPLAGAATLTWEVVFRPDTGGNPEQRFFHLSTLDPATGRDTNTRLLFETRLTGDRWCLDSYAMTGRNGRTLLNRERLHAAGAWYAAALVYDGSEVRNYVDGVMEGSGPLTLAPQGPGHTSVGTRINRQDYFKGAVRMARMTRRALEPGQFLKVPKA